MAFLLLLLCLIISKVIEIFGFEKLLYSAEVKQMLKEKETEESFYDILSKSDKMWMLKEEKFLRKHYGIHRFPHGVLSQLYKNNPPNTDKRIMKNPFYDILANQKYRNMFEYDSIINEKSNNKV